MSAAVPIIAGLLSQSEHLSSCCWSRSPPDFSACSRYRGCPGSIIRFSKPERLSAPRATASSFASKRATPTSILLPSATPFCSSAPSGSRRSAHELEVGCSARELGAALGGLRQHGQSAEAQSL